MGRGGTSRTGKGPDAHCGDPFGLGLGGGRGVIGMVGLVVPHMVRMLLGPDNRSGVPACFAFGGAFLLLVDDFSRSLTAFELPIGIFTTLVGGPFFIFLLRRSRLGWES